VRGLCLTTCSSRKSFDCEVRLSVAERRMRGMEAILSGEREGRVGLVVGLELDGELGEVQVVIEDVKFVVDKI